MPNVFLASDTHLGHRLMGRTRPWDTLEEHDEAIIDNWNKVVGPKDLVWHLGDVVMNRNKLPMVARLNGRKKLVMGNHDTHPIAMYLEHFEEVRGLKVWEWAVLTHVPVHVDQLKRFRFNIHGHLHGHVVNQTREEKYMDEDMGYIFETKREVIEPDPRYFCVAMENIDYKPIPVETVKEKLCS